MAAFWLGGVALLAVCDWISVWRCWHLGEIIFKPATLIALTAWFIVASGLRAPAGWFAAGLVFSLAGDILLMLPEHFFMGGLVAFLAAHLAYIAGFNQSLPPLTLLGLLMAAALMGAAFLLYRRVSGALTRRKSPAALRYGVLVYSLALTLMSLSAVLNLTRPGWSILPALLVAVGGLFFFASDSLLALDRFVAPIRGGKLLVHATYHLGQIGLMLGIASHLAGAF